ncbi:MAG: arylesterase [Pseudomonadota bacterium]
MGYGVLRSIRNVGLVTILFSSVAWAEEITVAAMGDSLTQGFGLPVEQGFVPQLQSWLSEQGHAVSLINAGVSGDTTAGGLSRIGWTLTDDVDALIVALGGNDMLRGIDPAVARSNLDGILTAAAGAGVPVLLVGMDAPANYGPEYETAFDAMYPELAEEYGADLHPNFLRALAALEDRDFALRTYMQGDGIHPNAEGVALIVSDIGPSVEALLARVK